MLPGDDGRLGKPGTPYWNWARLLGRVFDLDMPTCLPLLCGRREPGDLPFCRRGALRIIAAITQESVVTRILRHCKLASVPPPIAPARCRQEIFAFDYTHDPWRSLVGNVCAMAVYFTPLRLCNPV
jgi:hypothetical protein